MVLVNSESSVGYKIKSMYDLSSFKILVVQYLEFLLAEDFNCAYDLSTEIIFTKNIISKNLIVVPNFSKKIEDKIEVKKYLMIIISNINLRIILPEDMIRTLNAS